MAHVNENRLYSVLPTAGIVHFYTSDRQKPRVFRSMTELATPKPKHADDETLIFESQACNGTALYRIDSVYVESGPLLKYS